MTTTEITARIDDITAHRLGDVVTAMQIADPTMNADDCIDAIFSIGLNYVTHTFVIASMLPIDDQQEAIAA